MNKTCATPFGEWENVKGYSLVKDHNESYMHFWSVAVYAVTIPEVDPLTFNETDGTELRIKSLLSDDGSIPPFIWGCPGLSANRFEYAYLFHDFERKYGGLFFKGVTDTVFHFRRTTMLDADQRLMRGVGADGGNKAARAAIYRGVRLASSWAKFPSIDYWDAHHVDTDNNIDPHGMGIIQPA
jgi:hypothetical protein